MWVVREGYEGLVRGNTQEQAEHTTANEVTTAAQVHAEAEKNEAALIGVGGGGKTRPRRRPHENLLDNLRFGDGDLLRDGTSEYMGGRTLKGRYIVRVGWDDVHGWFSQVRQKGNLNLFSLWISLSLSHTRKLFYLGRYFNRNSAIGYFQNSRRSFGRRS